MNFVTLFLVNQSSICVYTLIQILELYVILGFMERKNSHFAVEGSEASGRPWGCKSAVYSTCFLAGLPEDLRPKLPRVHR